MRIHSTKKLFDEIPFKPEADTGEEENPLFSWHANLLVIDRRKTIVLMNDNNRYTIVLYGLKAKDLKVLDGLIVEAIRKTFKSERLSDEVIEQYISAAGAVTFHKTKNRSLVARLNKAVDNVWFYSREMDKALLINTNVSKNASRLLGGGGNSPSTYPYKELFKDLKSLVEGPVFKTRAAVMKVSMQLGEHSIWRRLLVPLDTSFYEMHRILQIAFDWHDYHLHEFYLYDESKTDEPEFEHSPTYTSYGYRPMLNIVMNEEAVAYSGDVEVKLEKGLLLTDFIPPHTYMKYIYDYGDEWKHEIFIEEIVTRDDLQSPVCLEGEGTAPPEDCGGEPGFDNFLKIMSDPSNPEYESMKSWARMQLYREFDMGLVNGRLRRY
ncbi:plasmid pRiA4b ORF-3 family protein [Sporosarcina thermotolerans]|uniref:Plasmid pRiA4b ORF-3 family protein n=1 Tax=Sporosarcina thermotolerans TaxID=633404 RepID=A0AAW9A4A7_9BACL|nr:plasmid pRiA4b ORF-3 family protein [Sporosarcina thermotolerans]MDW0116086.1 plasmid pRiA4b ORF-3 family protein [Sporosarcina thermotolerans]WHT48057.1 plasmid pRiA4b ORF-3 family protein [Sporosarcina thermotolerans]